MSPAEDARTVMVYRISWGAVLAGTAMALVVQLLLAMLGLGVGIATIDPGTNDNPDPMTFSLAAALWWVVSGVVAAGLGGMAAGRLSGQPSQTTAGMHGLTSWAFTTLVVVFLFSSAAGGVVGGAFNALGAAVGGLGEGAGQMAKTGAQAMASSNGGLADPWSSIEREVRNASGGNDPAALRDAAVSSVQAAVTGDPAKAAEARERAAQAIAKAQNISIEDARTKVGDYERQYRQAAEEAKAKAIKAAEVATKVISRSALFAFLGLLLGAVAGWFGGRAGKVDPIVSNIDAGVIR